MVEAGACDGQGPEHDDELDPTGERLQKVLARAGFGSRRACEELIVQGRVTVNGEVAVLGRRVQLGDTVPVGAGRVDPVHIDTVAVDGAPVPVLPGLVHYLLNKPPGVVSTADDPQGRPTVVSLVPDQPRVFSVGRLDYDSEGLIILTNDGALAQHLAHPSHGVDKEYLVEVEGRPGPAALRALRQGVGLDDGLTAPARVGVVSPGVLRIVVHQGRNRQVRRMCEAVGHPVRRLVRTRIGPISDPSLGPGHWRALDNSEVRALGLAAVAGVGTAPKGGGRGGRR